MEIVVSNKTSRPLYEQISTQIKSQIMNGELKAGEALPSIRSLSNDVRSKQFIKLFKNNDVYESMVQRV